MQRPCRAWVVGAQRRRRARSLSTLPRPAQTGHRLMPWTLLFLAGLLEIGWAVGLKYTEGFSRPWPTALTVAAMVGSVVLLGLAVKQIPLGTAYAVWTGIGVVGTALLGIAL